MMTYKELFQQLSQLSEEQLNKDVAIYDSKNQDEYYNVKVVFSPAAEDMNEVDYPFIHF